MPGRYLKSAARACAGKAKFESRLEAERTSEFRLAAYECAVCHKWHLTSKGRPQGPPPDDPAPEPTPERPFQTVEDALRAKVNARRQAKAAPPPLPREGDLPPGEIRHVARCAADLARDGRVLLVLEGKLVKSRKVLANLRSRIREGVWVRVAPTDDGPVIVEVLG